MIGQTQSAVLFELKRPLRILSLKLPPLKSGQVLVQMAYSGICHTQIHEVEGNRGQDRFLPHTLGHEGSGIVLEVGPGVQKVKPGDPVVLSWIKGAGLEEASAQYESPDGKINSGAISTFMTQAVISENRVVPINKRMPLKEAALLGCAIPTGAGIIFNTANVQKGETVAIFGVGGIGLSAVIGAKLRNAGMIIAIDIHDSKLDLAKKFGASHTINSKKQEIIPVIQEWTAGRGVNYAVESAGQIQTMEAAFQSVRTNGGLAILAGNLPFGQKISIDPFDLIKGKRLIGTWGGETQLDRDIPEYVRHYLEGRLELSKLITHEYSLPEINRAFEDIKKGFVARAILKLES